MKSRVLFLAITIAFCLLFFGCKERLDSSLVSEPSSSFECSPSMIYSVYVENGRLYFTQNNDELWEFKEDGKHKLIRP